MMAPGINTALNAADIEVCNALEQIRRLSDNGTWQGCAETNEIEVLRIRLEILELRDHLLRIQRMVEGREHTV